MEKVLEEISFAATDKAGTTLTIDRGYVASKVGELAKNADLSRFIL
jgi:ATP-dependent HslUV protease ATP-binding subunit HslU